MKPASEIYLTACERLGVAPRSSVFVGNGNSNELEGAVHVGMNACWATWFLHRWPEWRRSEPGREGFSEFTRVRSLAELVVLVAHMMAGTTGFAWQ